MSSFGFFFMLNYVETNYEIFSFIWVTKRKKTKKKLLKIRNPIFRIY